MSITDIENYVLATYVPQISKATDTSKKSKNININYLNTNISASLNRFFNTNNIIERQQFFALEVMKCFEKLEFETKFVAVSTEWERTFTINNTTKTANGTTSGFDYSTLNVAWNYPVSSYTKNKSDKKIEINGINANNYKIFTSRIYI